MDESTALQILEQRLLKVHGIDPDLVETRYDSSLNSGKGADALHFNCPVHGSDSRKAMLWVNDNGAVNFSGLTCKQHGCGIKNIASLLELDSPYHIDQLSDEPIEPRKGDVAEPKLSLNPLAAISDRGALREAAKRLATKHAGQKVRATITIAYTTDGQHCVGEIRWNRQTGGIRRNETGHIVEQTEKTFLTFTNAENNKVQVGKVDSSLAGSIVVLPGGGRYEFSEGVVSVPDALADLAGVDSENHIVIESDLPALVKDGQRGRTAVVVEGPKVAAVLAPLLSIEYDIICSLGGSGGSSKVDWTQLLRYDRVIVSPDNDKAGDSFAADVTKTLSAEGMANVQVIDYWQFPGIRTAGDDFYDIAHYALPNLDAFIDELERRRAVDTAADQDQSGEFSLRAELGSGAVDDIEPKRRAVLEKLRAITRYLIENTARQNLAKYRSLSSAQPLLAQAAKPDPTSQLVPNLIHRGHRTYLFGTKKTGKTTTLYRLMLDVAAGQPVFGIEKHKPLRPLSVLYIYGEGTEDEHRVRLATLADGRPDLYHDAEGKIQQGIVDRIYIHNSRLQLDDKDFLADLTRAAYSRQFDLIIIDPSYRCLSYDASQLNSYGKMIGKLQDAFGRSTILISHHMKKGTENQRFNWCPDVSKVVGTGMPEDSGCDIMLFAPQGQHNGPSPVRMEISGRICNAVVGQYLYRFDPAHHCYDIDFVTREEATRQGLIQSPATITADMQSDIESLTEECEAMVAKVWEGKEDVDREDLSADLIRCVEIMPDKLGFDTDDMLQRVGTGRRPHRSTISKAAKLAIIQRSQDQIRITHNESDSNLEFNFTQEEN